MFFLPISVLVAFFAFTSRLVAAECAFSDLVIKTVDTSFTPGDDRPYRIVGEITNCSNTTFDITIENAGNTYQCGSFQLSENANQTQSFTANCAVDLSQLSVGDIVLTVSPLAVSQPYAFTVASHEEPSAGSDTNTETAAASMCTGDNQTADEDGNCVCTAGSAPIDGDITNGCDKCADGTSSAEAGTAECQACATGLISNSDRTACVLSASAMARAKRHAGGIRRRSNACDEMLSSPDHCGSCADDDAWPVDCKRLEGVSSVGCDAGRCIIYECAEGFVLDSTAAQSKCVTSAPGLKFMTKP